MNHSHFSGPKQRELDSVPLQLICSTQLSCTVLGLFPSLCDASNLHLMICQINFCNNSPPNKSEFSRLRIPQHKSISFAGLNQLHNARCTCRHTKTCTCGDRTHSVFQCENTLHTFMIMSACVCVRVCVKPRQLESSFATT